jgi:hypothetical protein
MRTLNLRSFVFASLVLAAACGGKSTPAGGGGGGGGGGGTGPTEPPPGPLSPGQWETMDHEAQEAFMEHAVLPAMAAEFKAFDPVRFAEFNCKTCHGAGIDNHTYEMPNPDLPKLDFANPDPAHAKISEFMANKVKPGMATLLGLPEYSPENPSGFGCLACHQMKQ